MTRRTKRVKFKGDTGVVVPIQESTERWTEITLDDGSILRLKPVVARAIRLEGKFDGEGSPIYVVQSANVLTVDTLQRLCGGAPAPLGQVQRAAPMLKTKVTPTSLPGAPHPCVVRSALGTIVV